VKGWVALGWIAVSEGFVVVVVVHADERGWHSPTNSGGREYVALFDGLSPGNQAGEPVRPVGCTGEPQKAHFLAPRGMSLKHSGH